jgi:hypothetical protein
VYEDLAVLPGHLVELAMDRNRSVNGPEEVLGSRDQFRGQLPRGLGRRSRPPFLLPSIRQA